MAYQQPQDGNQEYVRVNKRKENCCFRLIRQLMKCLYPRDKRTCYTKESQYLQNMFWWITFVHNLLFAFSLLLIGFMPMIESTMMALWAYSIYLTMNEW